MNLTELSVLLLKECGESRERFFSKREQDAEADFFNEVKPYADEWHLIIQEWKTEADRFIRQNRPKHIHFIQIENAADGMTQFIVQSFYKETGKKRFIQTIQAAEYTLQTLIRAIEETGEER
ncbi:YppE family protein [Indiicoccus explosivorum]|uniref:YppE family protein n=1 Tax=Indiicoccus explosivorum TaxID=1917864 RepID=UPI000B44982C|nr:YppE family protein [Indiicoccus explosivorum]